MSTLEHAGPDAGTWKELSIGFDEAVSRLPEVLQREGFGIVTQMDVRETFKNKLGIDFRRYRIFGACSPSFAHQALTHTPQIGVLLPCNVVIYEQDDGGCMMGVIDPMQTVGKSQSAGQLGELAATVGEKLTRVLQSIDAK
jgi:uncharacterized protein (DUF302 family)